MEIRAYFKDLSEYFTKCEVHTLMMFVHKTWEDPRIEAKVANSAALKEIVRRRASNEVEILSRKARRQLTRKSIALALGR